MKRSKWNIIGIAIIASFLIFSIYRFLINENKAADIYQKAAIAFLSVFVLIQIVKLVKGEPPKKADIEEPIDPDVITDEEMDDFILEDGEFSYENYDEVCCPECGEFLGEDILICPSCKFVKAESPEFCESCGKPREEDVDFCPYCNRYYLKKF